MSRFETWLRKTFKLKEIGWKEIEEEFTRFFILKTPWFNIYLHKLKALQWHPQCHDHPWHFWAFVIWGGYFEHTHKGLFWRGPGSILYRQARFSHNVITKGVSWSVIVTSAKKREWGFLTCK